MATDDSNDSDFKITISNTTSGSIDLAALATALWPILEPMVVASFPGQKGTGSPLPNPPLNLTAGTPTVNTVPLSWSTPIGGALSYNVYRNGGSTPIATGVTLTTLTDTALSANTLYTYYVTAVNALGESLPSNTINPRTLPAAPTGLTAGTTTTTTVPLSWTAPTGGASTYNLYRNGSKVTTGIATTSTTDTGLTQSTNYSYTVTAQNATGEGAASNTASATTKSSSTAKVKWNPGHYTESDTVLGVGQTLANIKSEIDAMAAFPNIPGYMILVYWGFLQQAANTFTTTELDNIVSYIKSKGKRWALQVVAGIFNYGNMPPSAASTGPVPAYINNGNTTTWGTSGWRLVNLVFTAAPAAGATSATLNGAWRGSSTSFSIKFGTGESHTCTVTSGSTAITWSGGLSVAQTSATVSCNITQTIAGQSGWWGGDGNGHTYGAALWRPNIMNEWIKLHQALGAKYDSDPSFELIYQGEDSFYQGTGSTNNSDYNDTTQRQGWMNWLQALCASWPTSNVGFSETFLQVQSSSITLTNYITDTGKPYANHPPMMGQTDSLGAVQRSAVHTWGSQTYAGQLGTLGDRRPLRRFCAEVQAPDIGFFKNDGAPREDVLAGLNIMMCTHAFWAIVPSPTAQAALPNRYPCTFTANVTGTSATLASPWPLNTGQYDMNTGGGRANFVKGSTAVTFTVSQSQATNVVSIKYPLVPSNWSNGGTATAAQNGTSTSYTDPGLLVWINDPANALQTSAYPTDYP